MSTTRSTVHRIALAGACAAAALALAGCAGPAPTTSAPSSASTASATPTASTTPSASVTPSSAGAGASPAASASAASSTASTSGYRAARCDTAVLRGSLGGAEGAAGSTIVDLSLQNTGRTACTLQGWPGVSFITASGQQVGAAADLDRADAHQTVTLLPGGHAHASLKIADARNYPSASCDPVTVTRLRVYPPGSKASLVVTTSGTPACRIDSVHLLSVQAFHATT